MSSHALYRLEALTPLQIGALAGTRAVDRPTQKEAWTSLPFLPGSALKGVAAARSGKVGEGEANETREAIWGSPDRGVVRGKASRILFGDGELVSYPIGVAGERVDVFVAATIARFIRSEEREADEGPLLGVLADVERLGGGPTPDRKVWASPSAKRLLPGLDLGDRAPAAADRLVATVERLRGRAVGDAWIVASNALAGRLWPVAAERRTLTKLESGPRTVAAGSLRTVELIPVGTLFLSFVSMADRDTERSIPQQLQIGAWESQGLGWIAVAKIQSPTAPAAPVAPPEKASPPTLARVDVPSLMDQAHSSVRALGKKAPELAPQARAAVFAFGPRIRMQSLEAAFAFVLAKAKPANPKPKDEARAYRWLAGALLGEREWLAGADGPAAVLTAWQGLENGALRELSVVVETRWHWLRRFAELGLRPESGRASG